MKKWENAFVPLHIAVEYAEEIINWTIFIIASHILSNFIILDASIIIITLFHQSILHFFHDKCPAIATLDISISRAADDDSLDDDVLTADNNAFNLVYSTLYNCNVKRCLHSIVCPNFSIN